MYNTEQAELSFKELTKTYLEMLTHMTALSHVLFPEDPTPKICTTKEVMDHVLDEEENIPVILSKPKSPTKTEDVLLYDPGHPFGEITEIAWLAIHITDKKMQKNTAMIWYTFPALNKNVAYYYDPQKIEVDNGFAWNVEEGKHYIVQNQKWSATGHWMWNKIWEIPETVYNNVAFKVSKNIKPNAQLLRTLEDDVFESCNDSGALNPIQREMWIRAHNRDKVGKI